MSMGYLYFDANNEVRPGVYSLTAHGTVQDLARRNVVLHAGLQLTLYAREKNSNNDDIFLMVDAVIEEDAIWGFVARSMPGTWREEAAPPASMSPDQSEHDRDH